MDTLEFKRARLKLEEQYNIIQPALVLALLNHELFLPELQAKSYRELAEIAWEYQVFPPSGRVTRAVLLAALTESINNRLAFTKNEYTRVCAELEQLMIAHAQQASHEVAGKQESGAAPTQLWLLQENTLEQLQISLATVTAGQKTQVSHDPPSGQRVEFKKRTSRRPSQILNEVGPIDKGVRAGSTRIRSGSTTVQGKN
jgi:hypothetical protein